MSKSAIAELLDKAFTAFIGDKDSDQADVLNMLPKPDSQEIGDGIILWRWNIEGVAIVESVLATRTHNQVGMEKGKYVVNIQLPESENFSYAFFDDTAKDVAQAMLSAWNWQHIWKLHAGDFLLEVLSKEPVDESAPAEVVEPEIIAAPEPFVNNGAPIIEPEIIEG